MPEVQVPPQRPHDSLIADREVSMKWPIADIVYTTVVGGVMILALLEWLLWLAAFIYCLSKVYIKADRNSTRALVFIVGFLFTAFRCFFLPVMLVTLPLPSAITKYFPSDMVNILQWFGFWAFAGILVIPWLLCVYQLVTHQLGRTKRIKEILDESSAPKVVIVMPCYKEEPDVLLKAVDSVVDCDYPPSCIHVFLSFDGEQEDELFLSTIEKLGVPLSLLAYPKSIDVTYRTARITVSRFRHGGKRHCQKNTFKLIDKVYAQYLQRNDDLFILFIDSDCILDRVCLQNFVYDMELSPGNSKTMLAMTGVITSTTQKNSFLTVLQDMEYIHGQLFERTVESGCGAVTCLPGALTMLRFSAFRKMAKYYFADKAEQCEDLFDYGKCHLGEDRWLTHLFMIGAKKRYQIQMCTSAFCKTEAVQTYRSLVKQRRRWFLGFITNEACMLTDVRIWRRYPLLALVRFAQNTIRTTALLFFILILALMTTSKSVTDLPVGFIAISLGLNWLMMIYFGAKLKRFKIWLYPVMFVVNPFFNWYYMVYAIFTAGQRTWGGPRADAASAEEKAMGATEPIIPRDTSSGYESDGLPDSFAGQGGLHHRRVPLQPPDRVEGRFAAPKRGPGGWLQRDDRAFNMFGSEPQSPMPQLDSRMSVESSMSEQSQDESIYMPRRVESFMTPEEMIKYSAAKAGQRAAGGAYMDRPGINVGKRDLQMTEKRQSASSSHHSLGDGADFSWASPSRIPGDDGQVAEHHGNRESPETSSHPGDATDKISADQSSYGQSPSSPNRPAGPKRLQKTPKKTRKHNDIYHL